MTLLFLPIVLATAGCFSPETAQSVRTEPMRSEEIRVDTGGAPVSATAAHMAADLQLANGRTETGYIVGVYEPATGAFWWRYEVRNPSVVSDPVERLKQSGRFYLADSRLVSFAVGGRFLNIRESTDRVDSLQAGMNRARAALEAGLAEIEAGTKEWFTRVDLTDLGRDFFLRAGDAATLEPPLIQGIARGGGRWTVTLQGPNRDTAIVMLDDKFAVVSLKRQ